MYKLLQHRWYCHCSSQLFTLRIHLRQIKPLLYILRLAFVYSRRLFFNFLFVLVASISGFVSFMKLVRHTGGSFVLQ
jgi:hypothetical protein